MVRSVVAVFAGIAVLPANSFAIEAGGTAWSGDSPWGAETAEDVGLKDCVRDIALRVRQWRRRGYLPHRFCRA